MIRQKGEGSGQRQVELDDAVIEAGGKPGTLSETETAPEPEKKKSKPKQKEDPGPIFHSMDDIQQYGQFHHWSDAKSDQGSSK